MKRAVFDTNILIDFSRSHIGAQEIIRNCSERYISVVTWLEFLTGIPEPKIPQAKEFLNDVFDVIYPEESIYERTLMLRRLKKLKLPDAMIYATAKEFSVSLVTRNTKDFDGSQPDVHVPY
ncbi:MAG: VapC toxin family PIN domain ribonuclease [Alphaproteobacteria bacterium CG_4_9_14_3_um_filter_47_13]|nr:MAG: VapC toxin family PIN domain ribonuclease [Alphaproteobacteria bacterium CG_4_9_14_3_um_filter_47_13]